MNLIHHLLLRLEVRTAADFLVGNNLRVWAAGCGSAGKTQLWVAGIRLLGCGTAATTAALRLAKTRDH